MASIKNIKKYNDEESLKDISVASEVMIYAPGTEKFFTIKKSQVKEIAEKSKIKYRMTDKIFKVGRIVMLVQ